VKQGFFKVISRKEFLGLLAGLPKVGLETVELDACRGRILALDLIAGEDLPLADRSCMDGYAVRAVDVFGAGESNPAYLECKGDVAVNEYPRFKVKPGHCARIPTGGCLPSGTDSVVMVEYTHELGSGTIEIRKSVAPGENVMLKAEDVARGRLALPAGTRLRTQEIGFLAALGQKELVVYEKPKVGIISTGDEVVPVDSKPTPGKVRDVNSHTVRLLSEDAGAGTTFYGIVRDDLDALTEALEKALSENHIVFLSGGSSVGTRDLTIQALDSLPGSKVLAHGVGISPGKPTILARVGDKTILGLPGQTASAQVVMLVLGQPLIRCVGGDSPALTELNRPMCRAVLARNSASKQGREDYLRVSLEQRDGGPPLAHPVLGKSGLMRTLVRGRGLVVIPETCEGLYQGQEVDVWLI